MQHAETDQPSRLSLASSTDASHKLYTIYFIENLTSFIPFQTKKWTFTSCVHVQIVQKTNDF